MRASADLRLNFFCRWFHRLIRHLEAECLCGLEIQDELEFRCPLDRKVAGIGALENLVHEECRPAEDCNRVHSVTNHAASPWDLLRTYRDQPPPCRQRSNCSDVSDGQGIIAGLDRLHVCPLHAFEGAHQLAWRPQSEWLQFD